MIELLSGAYGSLGGSALKYSQLGDDSGLDIYANVDYPVN